MLQRILTTDIKISSLEEKIYNARTYTNEPCTNYYGMFLLDNTELGHNMLKNQLTIADYFFYDANSLNYSASSTVISQSTYTVTNNFDVVSPNDYTNFNTQIKKVMGQKSGGDKVSYFNVIIQLLQLNFKDNYKYSPNNVIVFFVSSQIQDLKSTSLVIKNLQTKNDNNVKILAIAMDSEYSYIAEKLVGDTKNVYTYNPIDQNRFFDINNWILQKTCLTQSPICNGFVNIVIDASSEGLTSGQYEKQTNLIKNYILPMWNDFSKLSIMMILDGYSISYRKYDSFENLQDVKDFIDNYTQSSSLMTDLTGALHSLNYEEPYASHKGEMSTFIFLGFVSDGEIYESKKYAKELSSKSRLNIITMGNQMTMSKVAPLNPSNVFNWDFSDTTITLIKQFFKNNMQCH